MHLPYDPANALLSIYPREMKTYVHTKAYEQVYIEALIVIAKYRNNPTVLPWLIIHPHSRILCSNKKNKRLIHATTWMDVVSIILSVNDLKRLHTI